MVKKRMAVLVLIMCLCVFVISGCKGEKKEFLEYQQGLFEAYGTLEINSDKYSIYINKQAADTYKISFDKPDNLKGVSIEKCGDKLTYSVGSVHIPIKEGTNITAESLKLFELSKDRLILSEETNYNGVKVNIKQFDGDMGGVKLYLLSETLLPIRIEAEINGVNVVMSFSSFNVIESINESDA